LIYKALKLHCLLKRSNLALADDIYPELKLRAIERD